MAARVETLRIPRPVWVTGLVIAGVSVVACLVIWHPGPLFGVAAGLMLASAPLVTRLDAVEIDGPRLRVRKLFRWVGPVDLRELDTLYYLPRTHRRPAAWLLIQSEVGPRLRWYWRINIEPGVRAQLAGRRELRVVEVAAGSRRTQIPGLADLLDDHVLSSDASVDQRTRVHVAAGRTTNRTRPSATATSSDSTGATTAAR